MRLSSNASLFGALASTVVASHALLSQDVLRDDAAYKHLDLTHDLLGFHKNLTQIESISGNEKEVGQWLYDSLDSQGYHVEKQVLSEDPLRFNVLAWPGSKRDAEVLVSSHIDTVSYHNTRSIDIRRQFARLSRSRCRRSTSTNITRTRPSQDAAR